MGKTVYSLVLATEVVDAIDALAAKRGSSRSALVNHILAEYASLQTPEKRNSQTLQATQKHIATHGFQAQLAPNGSLNLRTALRYKYNPALSYVVELWDEPEYLGSLKVGVRSQNETLLAYFGLFFDLWQKMEHSHLPQPPLKQAVMQQKRYSRALRRCTAERECEADGLAIGKYIKLLDDCINIFFSHLNDAAEAVRQTEAHYHKVIYGTELLARL